MSKRTIIILLFAAAMLTLLPGFSICAETGGPVLSRNYKYWRGEREVTPGPFLCTEPAVKNVTIVCDRWPDTSDMRQFGLDALRLSNAKTESDKCLAIFRWVRRVYLNGGSPYEPFAPGPDHIRWDGYFKWLHCYGTHHCSGMSRAFEMHWRAMGYPASKLHSGHTQALGYYVGEDEKGRWAYFDVNRGGYMMDRSGKRLLGLDETCVDSPCGRATGVMWRYQGRWSTHRSELSLRDGEKLMRLWGIDGPLYQRIIWPEAKFKGRSVYGWFKQAELGPYLPSHGTGRWTYEPDLKSGSWTKGLAVPLRNMAGSSLTPAATGKPATAEWHFRTPYIVAGAHVELDLVRKTTEDTIRLHLSLDNGATWDPLWECPNDKIGDQKLSVDICKKFDMTAVMQRKAKPPAKLISPFGRYSFRVKLELIPDASPKNCRVDRIAFRTDVQQNKFALPQLQPGRNSITVRGNLAKGSALRVTYVWDDPKGKGRKNVTHIEKMPHTYEIIAAGKKWEDCVCKSILVEAVTATGKGNNTVIKEEPSEIHPTPPLPSVHTTCDATEWGITKRGIPPKMPPFEEVLGRLNMKTNRSKLQREVIPQLIEYADPRAVEPLKNFIRQCERGKYAKCQKLSLIALHASEPDREKFKAFLKSFIEDTKVKNFCEGTIAGMVRYNNWPEFIPYLINIVKTGKGGKYSTIAALKTFAAMGDKRCGEAVAPLVRKGHTVAMLAAGRTEDSSVIPVLRERVKKDPGYPNNTRPAHINAVVALGMLKDKESIPDIIRYLKDPYIEMWRGKAAMSLAYMGEKSAIPALQAALDVEPVEWVRKVMKDSIEILKGKKRIKDQPVLFNGVLKP